MHIKSILTPLLLLSFATGLYNPIKAAIGQQQQNVQGTPVQIHVFITDHSSSQKANKSNNNDKTVSITLLPNQNQAQSNKTRIAIIHNIIEQIRIIKQIMKTSASPQDRPNDDPNQANQVTGRIVMEVPQDYITVAGFDRLKAWFTLLSNPTLAPCTTLLLSGKKTEEDKEDALTQLAKKKQAEMKGLFFTKQRLLDGINLHDDQIIFDRSIEEANKNWSLTNQKDIQKIIEAFREGLNSASDHKDKKKDEEANQALPVPAINEHQSAPLNSNASRQPAKTKIPRRRQQPNNYHQRKL